MNLRSLAIQCGVVARVVDWDVADSDSNRHCLLEACQVVCGQSSSLSLFYFARLS